MIKLLRELMVIAMMLVVVSTGAFAQRKGDQDKDKRPPKDPVKVVTNDRKEPRPPRNDDKRPKDKPPKP